MNSHQTYSPAELKLAYRLVTADLHNSLLKMKGGENLRLSRLGKFTKKTVRAKCGLDRQTYIYYRINFSPFGSLKNALNQSLESQYELR